MSMQPKERPHRLDRECYQGTTCVAFTLCIQNRGNLFSDPTIVETFEQILLETLKTKGCSAHVYLFMPDHLHLLVDGDTEKSDLWETIVLFKQKTGYWLSKNKTEFSWQKDFFDHVMRKDEDLEKHIRYILDNPERKGLVRDWRDYPYKGSTLYKLDELDV